jgi:catechol 2,3-dioxygenase-like lactoylglutathione lyase family enzyme
MAAVMAFSFQTIDHVFISARNAPQLLAFYVDALGCRLAWITLS